MEWLCAKCGNNKFEKDKIQTTSGNFSKLFDIQNKKFIAVTCTNCGYTEFYKSETSAAMNILDFLMD